MSILYIWKRKKNLEGKLKCFKEGIIRVWKDSGIFLSFNMIEWIKK